MRTRYFIAFISAIFLIQAAAMASPARVTRPVLKQPDGSTFNAILRGDEFMKILTTEDGCAIIQDENGWYCYAFYSPEGEKLSSGIRVGQAVPAATAADSRRIPYGILYAKASAKRASAHCVIAVMPYFGWARQDRKDKPRVSIGAKLVANILHAAGCDRVMTCDLHADQIQGFFDFPVDHVYASTIFLPYLREKNIENLAIAAPDMGGAKRANAYARYLQCPVIICHKSRERANVVGSITAIGDVAGKNVIIVDDMIDTAGTLTKAANVLKEMGALSVRACATHAVFSGNAYERIANSALEEVIVTDTIPLSPNQDKDKSKITVLSVADMFASIIYKVYNDEPISPDFII